jgi:release factor glutamine methyltransferase
VEQPVTLGAALNEAVRALADVSTSARTDAEVLLIHVCGITRTILIARADAPITDGEHHQLTALVQRRRDGEPIAYLTGMREFWSLPLRVTPDVLIPRPETEIVVERALARLTPGAHAHVCDLGTGSGAIALAIAHERPQCRIVATDLSPRALDVARDNAHQLMLPHIEFRQGDLFAPLGEQVFDVIVSNPPYVRANDPHLNQGDVRFEPESALVAGTDGLDAIRKIVSGAGAHLCANGWLILEHGYDQAAAVAEILEHGDFTDIVCHPDFAGHPRVTEARRR